MRGSPRCDLVLTVAVLVVSACLSTIVAFSQPRPAPVDARFAPSPAYSLLCFPNDPLKTVVTDQGELGYDFGPGPYARPLTRIGFALANDTARVQRQWLEDARVPIVQTILAGRSGSLLTRALSWRGHQSSTARTQRDMRYRRVGGENGCVAWADPPAGAPRELRSVAWGTNRPIAYRVKVKPGGRKLVALGFCESYKRSPKSRTLDVRVEGALPRILDPIPHGTRNEPVLLVVEGCDENRDGEISVEIHPAVGGSDPNVILNAIWIFPEGASVSADDILSGHAGGLAELAIPCGEELEGAGPESRVDVITATVQGDVVPVVLIRSRRGLQWHEEDGVVMCEGRMSIRTNPLPHSGRVTDGGLDLIYPAGIRQVQVIVSFGVPPAAQSADLPPMSALESEMRTWWLDSSGVPFGRIQVPDPAIQYLLDAGVRTMYQVRDCVDGSLQFQPGPSVYRGLWIGDVGVPWIAALLLGDTAGTREYLDVILRQQGADGQVRVMTPVPSLIETPLLVFAIVQYARATGDMTWLEQKFHSIVAAVHWMRHSRDLSMADPLMPYAGLLPPGFVDGGISTPATDYGTVFWTIIGLEHAIDAAHALGRERDADEWSQLLDGFMRSLHGAIARDARPDSGGALFLPVTLGNVVAAPPQRGMASQVFPVPFGAMYERDTVLQKTVRGCLQCVDRRQEQGVPVGVGWLPDGLWPSWFGTFAVIAQCMYGDANRGRDLLYAIANHATSAGSWAEEQLPQRLGAGTGGDMANAQSAAAFIMAVRLWIARERSEDLELFAAVPQNWFKAGARMALHDNSGRFGPFSISSEVDPSGAVVRIMVATPDGRGSRGHVRLSLESVRRAGFSVGMGEPLSPERILPWGATSVIELRRKN